MRFVLSLTAILAMTACAAGDRLSERSAAGAGDAMPQTRPLAGKIEPIRRPMLSKLRSMKVRSLVDGRTDLLDIRPYGDGIRVREPDGCVWTKALDWFAPSDSYANCGNSANWQSAQARVRRVRSPFTLQVGSRGEYRRHAVSGTGKVSKRRTVCKVGEAVEVLLPDAAPVPAYVVVCDDGRVERTTWYAPGLGPVAYREVHIEEGVRDAWVRLDTGRGG